MWLKTNRKQPYHAVLFVERQNKASFYKQTTKATTHPNMNNKVRHMKSGDVQDNLLKQGSQLFHLCFST